MTYISPHSVQPTGGNNNNGAAGIVVIGAGVLAAVPIVTLFAVSAALSVLLGLYAILCLPLFFAAADARKNTGWIRFALIVSVGAALLIQPLCFATQSGWFTIMGAVVTGGYVLALALGLWQTFESGFKAFAALVAAVLLTVLVILPPPEAAGSAKDSAKWSVQITVLDADNKPIAGALTQCTTVMVWEEGRRFKFKAAEMDQTDADGKAEYEFSAATRFKAALCGAAKPAGDNEPGYALRSGIVVNPLHGGKFPLTIVLDEQIPAGTAATDLPPNYQGYVVSKTSVTPPDSSAPPAEPDPSASTTTTDEATSSEEAAPPSGPLTPSIQNYPTPTPAPAPAQGGLY